MVTHIYKFEVKIYWRNQCKLPVLLLQPCMKILTMKTIQTIQTTKNWDKITQYGNIPGPAYQFKESLVLSMYHLHCNSFLWCHSIPSFCICNKRWITIHIKNSSWGSFQLSLNSFDQEVGKRCCSWNKGFHNGKVNWVRKHNYNCMLVDGIWHVACMGERRGVHRVLVGKPEGKRPMGRPRHRWEDNIKWIFGKSKGVETGWSWLSIGTDDGHLWIRWWTFGFYKVWGISWLAANQLASQEGPSSME